LSTNRLVVSALVACLALGAPAAAQEDPTGVTCTACLVVDDTGHVLFARNASTMLPNASTTKMTTALLVVAEADPAEDVVVSASAAATGGGGLDLHAGEIFSVEALLYALLLDSSNDAAVALAEHVAGSQGAFVDEMNDLAAELGATDTNYVTAHGLDMPGHGSSARDLALIAGELLDDPLLADIVATTDAQIDGPAGLIPIENRNVLLEGYAGLTGVKTGFTAGAGNVLVAAAERDGRTLISVAMDSVDAFADSRVLLDHGWDQLARTVLLPRGKRVAALVFDQGSTDVVAADPVRDAIDPTQIDFTFHQDSALPMPVSPGDVVGRVVVTSDDGTIDTVAALATQPVGSDTTSWLSDAVIGLLHGVGSLIGP
jgi:serine-type D-Ala-D-Ala carboxypeptidase (penicillin-binding protein 5/6)